MKILHIISSPAAGGAEMYVKDLSIAMAKSGHEIFILFVSHAEEIARDAAFEAKFLQEITLLGIKYDFIGNSCKKNPFKGIFKTWRVSRAFKPDIVHSHLYFGAVFSLFAHAKGKIYTHHNIDLGANKRIYNILDLGMDAYIGICGACEEMLKDLTRKPVVRINNGVDSSRIKRIENYSPRDPVQVFMAGRLTEQKNFLLMLQVLQQNPQLNIALTIAGEGPESAVLKDYVVANGLSSRVVFLGNCDNVKQLMADADVFAMTSAWEGLPIALIEATLTGLPVIVTNVGGCAEIVNEVNNGVIVKTLSPAEYSACLSEMIANKDKLRELHLSALSNSQTYTIDFALKKHMTTYQQVVDARAV